MANVLVVDDDLLFHRVIRFMLQRNQHTVITTDSTEEAWITLGKRPVDIAFVDLDIPGTNGIFFLEQLRADTRYTHLPVVILTASPQWDDRIEALNRGATAFLQKPASSWELTETIDRLLPETVGISQL